MKFELLTSDVTRSASDVLVVGYYSDAASSSFNAVDVALGGALSTLVQDGDIKGSAKDLTIVHTFGKIPAKRVFVIGLGEHAKATPNLIREVAAIVVKEAGKLKSHTIAVLLTNDGGAELLQATVQASVEGALLGSYHFEGYHSKKEAVHQVQSVQFFVPEVSETLQSTVKRAQIVAESVVYARDLMNLPGNMLTPTVFAEKGLEMANRHGFTVEVLDAEAMRRLGMGGILAVAQGSVQPPKMIALTYRGNPGSDEVIGFVGKGITFDSGGISLKPGENMDKMKMDMGGAAAVFGAMEAIGQLKPKVNITAVVATTENMPSGAAYKPGDVISTMSGKTIEVLNTDAEGRIVLADAVYYAKHLGATKIIDLATLTGAVVVALGNVATAAMTNDDAFLQDFLYSSQKTGEKVWQLPTYDEYKEQIKSKIADVKNLGGRGAGTITGGLFIGTFVEDTPWIHLDIAGTAWSDNDTTLVPTGGAGVMVRSLVQFAEDAANGNA